jgi:hypothetical protein
MTDLIKKVYDTDTREHRVFLVVVDDSEEMLVALRFACMRAKKYWWSGRFIPGY